MRDELITFETAKLAKKKGFKIKCQHYYNSENPLNSNIQLKEIGWGSFQFIGEEHTIIHEESGLLQYKIDTYCETPTQSLLQKWLREKHLIHIELQYSYKVKNSQEIEWWFYLYPTIGKRGRIKYFPIKEDIGEKLSYEEALEKGLQEALKLIK